MYSVIGVYNTKTEPKKLPIMLNDMLVIIFLMDRLPQCII